MSIILAGNEPGAGAITLSPGEYAPNVAEAGVWLGISPSTEARIREWNGRWARWEGEMRRHTEYQIGLIGSIIAQRVREEWIAGGHDKTGASLRTLQVNLEGYRVQIVMGGGAVYVQFGSCPHLIQGNPLLHFKWAGGPSGDGWYTFASVWHPGYHGDDVFGRAVAKGKESAVQMLDRVAYDTFAEVYGIATDRRGSMYTGGEQLGQAGAYIPGGGLR